MIPVVTQNVPNSYSDYLTSLVFSSVIGTSSALQSDNKIPSSLIEEVLNQGLILSTSDNSLLNLWNIVQAQADPSVGPVEKFLEGIPLSYLQRPDAIDTLLSLTQMISGVSTFVFSSFLDLMEKAASVVVPAGNADICNLDLLVQNKQKITLNERILLADIATVCKQWASIKTRLAYARLPATQATAAGANGEAANFLNDGVAITNGTTALTYLNNALAPVTAVGATTSTRSILGVATSKAKSFGLSGVTINSTSSLTGGTNAADSGTYTFSVISSTQLPNSKPAKFSVDITASLNAGVSVGTLTRVDAGSGFVDVTAANLSVSKITFVLIGTGGTGTRTANLELASNYTITANATVGAVDVTPLGFGLSTATSFTILSAVVLAGTTNGADAGKYTFTVTSISQLPGGKPAKFSMTTANAATTAGATVGTLTLVDPGSGFTDVTRSHFSITEVDYVRSGTGTTRTADAIPIGNYSIGANAIKGEIDNNIIGFGLSDATIRSAANLLVAGSEGTYKFTVKSRTQLPGGKPAIFTRVMAANVAANASMLTLTLVDPGSGFIDAYPINLFVDAVSVNPTAGLTNQTATVGYDVKTNYTVTEATAGLLDNSAANQTYIMKHLRRLNLNFTTAAPLEATHTAIGNYKGASLELAFPLVKQLSDLDVAEFAGECGRNGVFSANTFIYFNAINSSLLSSAFPTHRLSDIASFVGRAGAVAAVAVTAAVAVADTPAVFATGNPSVTVAFAAGTPIRPAAPASLTFPALVNYPTFRSKRADDLSVFSGLFMVFKTLGYAADKVFAASIENIILPIVTVTGVITENISKFTHIVLLRAQDFDVYFNNYIKRSVVLIERLSLLVSSHVRVAPTRVGNALSNVLLTGGVADQPGHVYEAVHQFSKNVQSLFIPPTAIVVTNASPPSVDNQYAAAVATAVVALTGTAVNNANSYGAELFTYDTLYAAANVADQKAPKFAEVFASMYTVDLATYFVTSLVTTGAYTSLPSDATFLLTNAANLLDFFERLAKKALGKNATPQQIEKFVNGMEIANQPAVATDGGAQTTLSNLVKNNYSIADLLASGLVPPAWGFGKTAINIVMDMIIAGTFNTTLLALALLNYALADGLENCITTFAAYPEATAANLTDKSRILLALMSVTRNPADSAVIFSMMGGPLAANQLSTLNYLLDNAVPSQIYLFAPFITSTLFTIDQLVQGLGQVVAMTVPTNDPLTLTCANLWPMLFTSNVSFLAGTNPLDKPEIRPDILVSYKYSSFIYSYADGTAISGSASQNLVFAPADIEAAYGFKDHAAFVLFMKEVGVRLQ